MTSPLHWVLRQREDCPKRETPGHHTWGPGLSGGAHGDWWSWPWLGMEMEGLGESGGMYCPGTSFKCHRRGSADPEAPSSFCETTEQRGSFHPGPLGQIQQMQLGCPGGLCTRHILLRFPQESRPPGAVSQLAFLQPGPPALGSPGRAGMEGGADSEGQSSPGWSCWPPGSLTLSLAPSPTPYPALRPTRGSLSAPEPPALLRQESM
uniref:Uncharacterized protein n=1 Tax=Molossus molossus TaxID=27622 RepID=A0A7J8HGP0_MOLMO|nr:hypothetical protein HJG59_010913 [Molossus molossus]